MSQTKKNYLRQQDEHGLVGQLVNKGNPATILVLGPKTVKDSDYKATQRKHQAPKHHRKNRPTFVLQPPLMKKSFIETGLFFFNSFRLRQAHRQLRSGLST